MCVYSEKIQNRNPKCRSLIPDLILPILPYLGKLTVWNNGICDYEGIFFLSLHTKVFAPRHTSQQLHITTSARTHCVLFAMLYSCGHLGKTVRQCRGSVDQSFCLYDHLDSLPHFLKKGDCLKLSALETEVNWNLALGDFFLPCFLSL